jgi:hypothetical protein
VFLLTGMSLFSSFFVLMLVLVQTVPASASSSQLGLLLITNVDDMQIRDVYSVRRSIGLSVNEIEFK